RDRPRDLRRERDPQPARVVARAVGERLRRSRRLVAVLGAVARQHVKQQRRVVDRARERPDAGEAVEGGQERPGGDAPTLRLDAHEVRPGGGDPHRAGAVGAGGGGHEAGGDGGRRAAGGAAGRVVERPRVARGAERRALGERPLAHLGRVRLADDHGAGGAQLARDLAVAVTRVEGAGAAEVRRLAREVHVVLDRDRDAEQRQALAVGVAAIGRVCLGAGGVGAHAAEGVERRLRGVDARERGVDQLARGGAAGRDELGLRTQAGEGEVVGGVHVEKLPQSVVRTNDRGSATMLRHMAVSVTPSAGRTDTRVRILHATLRVIAAGGVGAVSNRRVAAEAGVALGSLTYHFPSQTDLLRESLLLYAEEEVTRLERLAAELRRAAAGGDGVSAEQAAAVVEQVAARDAGRPEEIAELELHLH